MQNDKAQADATELGQKADTSKEEKAAAAAGDAGQPAVAGEARDVTPPSPPPPSPPPPGPPSPPPPSPAPEPLPDDPPADPELLAARKEVILAESSRDLAAASEELATTRDTAKAAYSAKLAETLTKRYADADRRFMDTAADLLRNDPDQNKPRLQVWVDTWLTATDSKLRKQLQDRSDLAKRLDPLRGKRQNARDETTAAAARWKKAFADWSRLQDAVDALLSSYEQPLVGLNETIGSHPKPDREIFEFWFEVAPLHLQLRKDPVTSENAPGIDIILAGLADFTQYQDALKSGAERQDGSVYLVDPDNLQAERVKVRDGWKQAVEPAAAAQADYALRPDDAAALQTRLDALVQAGIDKDATFKPA